MSKNSEKMPISFAIGCYHFGVNLKKGDNFSGREYVEKLKNTLNAIPYVSNVKIFSDKNFLSEKYQIRNKLPELRSGKGFFPKTLFLEIEFDVDIPIEISNRILNSFLHKSKNNFKQRVTIKYPYHYPVTFIRSLNNDHLEESPSTAIVLIREYINESLPKVSKLFDFQCLGPSPYHLDAYLNNGPISSAESEIYSGGKYFSQDKIENYGYNKKIFWVASNGSEDINDLYQEIEEELSFSYELYASRSGEINHWYEIEAEATFLTEKRNPLIKILFWIFYRNKIGKIHELVFDFQKNRIFNEQSTKDSFRLQYEQRRKGHFKNIIRRQIEGIEMYPISELMELISFYEQRWSNNLNLFASIFSAVLGAVAGYYISFII